MQYAMIAAVKGWWRALSKTEREVRRKGLSAKGVSKGHNHPPLQVV